MSLKFINGFFPWGIIDQSKVVAPSDANTSGPITIPLTMLGRMFWLAKSFDWQVGLAYTAVSNFPLNPGQVASGTAVGSGTQTIKTVATASRVTGATPPERTGPENLPFPIRAQSAFDNLGTYTDTCQAIDPSTGIPIGVPNINVFPFSLNFFSGLSIAGGSFGTFGVGNDKSAKNYNVYMSELNGANPGPLGIAGALEFCFVSGGPGPLGYVALSDLFQINPEPPATPTSAKITIQATGMADVTVPLFVGTSQDIAGFPYTIGVSGGIVINFNNFWTP